jgi:hypothetical protein
MHLQWEVCSGVHDTGLRQAQSSPPGRTRSSGSSSEVGRPVGRAVRWCPHRHKRPRSQDFSSLPQGHLFVSGRGRAVLRELFVTLLVWLLD